MTQTTETFYDGNTISGFTASFCDWLTELFGVPFIPGIYDWGELSTGLENHTIDFTGELTATEERRQNNYFMTDSIAERTITYLRLEDAVPLSELAATRKLNFAFLADTINRAQVAAVSDFEFESFYIDDYETAYEMLKDRTIDAFLTEGVAEAAFGQYSDIVSSVFIPLIYAPVSMSTLNPDLQVIISVVCKLLEQDSSIHHMAELYKEGQEAYLVHRLYMHLTEEEIAYIEKNKSGVIPFLARYDNYPLCFYNTYDKQWQGIAFDVLLRIEALTGLTFEISNAPGTEMAKLLSMLENKEAPMITELLRTKEREENFLWPSSYVMTDHYALISKTETPNISFIDILRVKVGLIENAAFSDLFLSWFPDHKNIAWYASPAVAFEALKKGDIDMFMGTENMLLLETNFHEEPGYKANIVFERAFESTFAFLKDEAVLCSIVDKSLHLIDTSGISAQWTRRTYDYRAKLAQARVPVVFFGTAAVSLLILLLFIYRRNKNEGARLELLVQQRTSDLKIAADAQMSMLSKLEQAVEDAEASSRAKSVFLANMSHEIRTPLNSIIGFSELAMDDVLTPQTQERLEQIIENSKWLLQIINDVLDISKVESGKMDIESVPFDLGELLTHCQSVIIPKAMEKNINLQFYAEPFIGRTLLGDPTRLRQVIVNILSNAIKFTHVGSVKVSATVSDMTESSCKVLFEIRDSGIGMAMDQLERIFKPFEQADTSTTRKYGGTGLGLPITKNIIELMGGELSVDSTLGVGSSFRFVLPFDTIETPIDSGTQKYSVGDIARPIFSADTIVLVCEDNKMNQRVIQEHLKRVGLQVVIAENGKVGVDLVRGRLENNEKPFDLIFMDIHMPEMDGLEAAYCIMQTGVGSPIIALTANVMNNDLVVYNESGMNDYMSKPFTSQELWAFLLKYLEPIDNPWATFKDSVTAETAENALYTQLKLDFHRSNRHKLTEITRTLEANDVQHAYRLVHSLKSNAALIGRPKLQAVAAEIEQLLTDGENRVEKWHIERLDEELDTVLRDLEPLLRHSDRPARKPPGTMTRADIKELFRKLKPLLSSNNTDCLDFIDDLLGVEGSEPLIEQMENFEFIPAVKTLAELEQKMEES